MSKLRTKTLSRVQVIFTIVGILLMLIGSGVIIYPTISDYFAKKNQTEVIESYKEKIEEIEENEEEIQEEFEKAKEYNENLAGDPVHDPFIEGSGYAIPENYEEVLNLNGNGVMAYIEIPKIKAYLPIYHGTETETLSKGIGHVYTTSVPIGGNSTHSVLIGHTGLPTAELFTRLDELVEGDIFYINVLNEVLTYKVYEIKVILPEEMGELYIEKGKDLVTLVTCTPYAVNTHRLLVKAERTEYVEYEEYMEEEGTKVEQTKAHNYYLSGVEIGLFIFIIIVIIAVLIKTIIKRGKTNEVN